MEIRIFISSVQREFESERRRLYDYIQQDALLGKFFVPYIFEAEPAQNVSATTAYIQQVKDCDIYIGLCGEDYGYEDAEGVSPTEREYDAATSNHKARLIFLKETEQRHPKELVFIHKIEKDVVRKTFTTYESLQAAVYVALVRYLEDKEFLRLLPFDAAVNKRATLDDIDEDRVERFVNEATKKRNFPIPFSAGIPRILTHLDLMTEDGRLTNSALLLFAKKPQSFFITSEVKCIQFYGTVPQKPIPSYQIFKGNVFELVDQAVGFVMSRINAGVSDRHSGAQADISYEIPIQAVTEAIVNAVVHRDYTSNGSVQVMLFRDRLEIWNPGRLPFGLTPEKLTKLHSSKPVNPTLANAVFLAGYIEKVGTGTCDMIDYCREAGLRQPEFIQEEDFCVTIWRGNTSVSGENASRIAENTLDFDKQSNIAGNIDSNIDSNIVSNIAELTVKQRKVLKYCTKPRSAQEILDYLKLTKQTKNFKRYITDLVSLGHLRPIVIGRATSPNQKYITANGILPKE